MVALTPLLFAPHAVRAIDYPEKPVRIVVPTGAGGAVDVVVRLEEGPNSADDRDRGVARFGRRHLGVLVLAVQLGCGMARARGVTRLPAPIRRRMQLRW